MDYEYYIRNHIPPIWDLTLRYCRCRTKWILYVYKKYIRPIHHAEYVPLEKSEKKFKLLKNLLNPTKTNFKDTVFLQEFYNSCNSKEAEFWKSVFVWYDWFSKNMKYIENICTNGWDEKSVKNYLKNSDDTRLLNNIEMYIKYGRGN